MLLSEKFSYLFILYFQTASDFCVDPNTYVSSKVDTKYPEGEKSRVVSLCLSETIPHAASISNIQTIRLFLM